MKCKLLQFNNCRNGYNGTSCLLRAICESAEMPLYEHNGILGDIFHIILTPSSSTEENIEEHYYEAEKVGGKTQDCALYRNLCPKSVFDLITTVFNH